MSEQEEEIRTIDSYAEDWEHFLRGYKDVEGIADKLEEEEDEDKKINPYIYFEMISDMMRDQKQSIIINYEHLNSAIIFEDNAAKKKDLGELARLVLGKPDQARESARIAVRRILEEIHPEYEKEIKKKLKVSFSDIGIKTEIPYVNHELINTYVVIEGFATTMEQTPRPLIKQTSWKCINSDWHWTDVEGSQKPGRCFQCGKPIPPQTPEILDSDTTQEFELQERFDKANDRMPSPIPVLLLGKDMMNTIVSGDYVEVSGIVRVRLGFDARKSSRGEFYIEASVVRKKEDDMFLQIFQRKTAFLEEKVKQAIRVGTKYENDDFWKCVDSVAPSIYGHRIEKLALYLQAIGSVKSRLPDGTRIRGDINILFCGDPSSGKSVLARYAGQLHKRFRYVTGGGATKVGLTASINTQDGISKLDPGPFIMCSGGLVALDEFQLLEKKEYGVLLEVMDDAQTISIWKRGATTSKPLSVSASTLALCNPKNRGRWDRSKNIHENTDIESQNLARFDAIFIYSDEADTLTDTKIAEHWLKHYAEAIPEAAYEEANEEYLREIDRVELEGKIHSVQYMAYLVRYIKKNFKPKFLGLQDPMFRAILEFYVRRRNITVNIDTDKETDITRKISALNLRQLGGLLRFALASAGAHFRNYLTEKDIELAMDIVDVSIAGAYESDRTGVTRGQPEVKPPSIKTSQILYRAEQLQGQFSRAWLSRVKMFENGIKRFGFGKCTGPCHGAGLIKNERNETINCYECGGTGGKIIPFRLTALDDPLRNEGWFPKEIEMMTKDFINSGVVKPTTNQGWYEIADRGVTGYNIKTKTWIEQMNSENYQKYQVEGFMAASQMTERKGIMQYVSNPPPDRSQFYDIGTRAQKEPEEAIKDYSNVDRSDIPETIEEVLSEIDDEIDTDEILTRAENTDLEEEPKEEDTEVGEEGDTQETEPKEET